MSKHQLGTVVVFDIASTAVLLLLSLTVAFVRPPPEPKDPAPLDEVTPILVARVQPRRALIFSLLSLTALTYFADGAVDVLRAVLVGTWTKSGPVGLVSYILGLLSFGSLAIFLSWKDLQDVSAWGRKRVRVFAALAVTIHVVHVILVAATGHLKRTCWTYVLPQSSNSYSVILIRPSPPCWYSRETVAAERAVLAVTALRCLHTAPPYPDPSIPGPCQSL